MSGRSDIPIFHLKKLLFIPGDVVAWSYGSWIYNYRCNRYLSQLMLWFRLPLRARCAILGDKVCQWLAAGRWFSPVSSTNKTDRHDITEILLKVALNTKKPNQPYLYQHLLTEKFYLVPVPSQEIERSGMIGDINFASISMIFLLDFGIILISFFSFF